MSASVAGMSQAGEKPVTAAVTVDAAASGHATLDEPLAFTTKLAPKLTIQGGASEAPRGIIARGLGLR